MKQTYTRMADLAEFLTVVAEMPGEWYTSAHRSASRHHKIAARNAPTEKLTGYHINASQYHTIMSVQGAFES